MFVFKHRDLLSDNTVYSHSVADRVRQTGYMTQCTVTPDDRDPFNQGLHPRTEVRPKITVPNDFILVMSCVVSGDNVTFLQIMGRDQLRRGKPLLVLDTHDDILHVRYNNFNGQMIRVPLFKPDYSKDIEVQLRGRIDAVHGLWDVKVTNGDQVGKYLKGQPTYFQKSFRSLEVSFGVYLTGPIKTNRVMSMSRLFIQEYKEGSDQKEEPQNNPVEPVNLVDEINRVRHTVDAEFVKLLNLVKKK